MNTKVSPEHLARGAVAYVRQSSPGQVIDHTESQRRQYELADTARAMGFTPVSVIDDDLGRSGSGQVKRPGFDKLVAQVCTESIGAIFCIEASRLARNGRDWHLLVDFCALSNALIIDTDGVYDPRLINDRLLLGLKGTMSEYELSLLRQRGIAARDSLARRGELRFSLPPGYCWDGLDRIEKDPDERIQTALGMVFEKFNELGSARQVMFWIQDAGLKLPVYRQGRGASRRIEWRASAYHTVLKFLQHPIYAGAYVFGRTHTKTEIQEARARKSTGHVKDQSQWSVLIKDNHEGYITWTQYEENQRSLSENAFMLKSPDRKSGRGGQALLSGKLRCGRCGRMMRVIYGSQNAPSHRYLCRGGVDQHGGEQCIGVGGVRVDKAVVTQIVEAVSAQGIAAAGVAAEKLNQVDIQVRQALSREHEEAHYEASLAARRHEAVDPEKRLVAKELEARWNCT